jgi:hypothetical protein
MSKQQSPFLSCGLIAGATALGMLFIGGALFVYTTVSSSDAIYGEVDTRNAPAQVQATLPSAPTITPQAVAPVSAPAAQSSAAQPVAVATPAPIAPAALPPEPAAAATLPSVAQAIAQQAQPLPTYTPYPTLLPNSTYTPYPTPTPLPTATPLPVVDWQRSGTLEVLNWTTTIVIDKERQKEGVKSLIPGRDRVVLVVTGKLRAGVDLTRVQPQNVVIDGTSIKIVVPQPSIVGVELLPDESRVYDAERTWFLSEYTGLEVEAMDEAKRQLASANPTNTRMLESAEAVARLQLTNFLRDLGFQKVDVIFAR